jgi:hypothetical protein
MYQQHKLFRDEGDEKVIMHGEMKMTGEEKVVVNLRYYLGIVFEGLRKATENVSQASRCPGRDSDIYNPQTKRRRGKNRSRPAYTEHLSRLLFV